MSKVLKKPQVAEIPSAVSPAISPLAPRGLRISDAATYMGVTPWFVEEAIRSGKLPAHRICRHYTILREDLDAFLDHLKKDAA